MGKYTKINKEIGIILLLLIVSLPSILFLLHAGFFQSDDGEWMIIRFSAFHEALRDGQFPVRWLNRLNNGYGYPVANFVYPGFMYLAEIPKLLGFGFIASIKIILGIAMLASALFTYAWLKKLFNKWIGFIASIIYLYSPYHLFDLYKRGSIGEILALATVPFVFWQIERKSFFWTAVGIGVLILFHNTLAVIFLPIIFVYGLLRQKNVYSFLFALFLGFCLSAFFWIPALYDLNTTVFSQTKVSQWQQYFVDFYLVGISTVFIFSLSSYLLFVKQQDKKIAVYFFIIGIISLFLTTSVSKDLWNIFPVSFIQFPFRLLSVTLVATSFLVAYILANLQKKLAIIIGMTLVILTLLSAKTFIMSPVFLDKNDSYYATNESTTTVMDEYMPIWVKSKPLEHAKTKIEIIKGKGIIKNVSFNSKEIRATVNLQTDSIVQINSIYFPGWNANIDNKKTDILYENKKGLIEIVVPQGIHTIAIWFTETPIRLISDVISFSAFVCLISINFFKKKIQYKKHLYE